MFPDRINYILENLEQEAEKYANISRETAIFLFTLVKLLKPQRILEIGTSNGYSSIWLSLGNPQAEIITIEKNPERTHKALNNFKQASITNIELRQGNALEIIPSFNKLFDFVFIDGTKAEYITYLQLLKTKLSNKAVIICDNAESHKEKIQTAKDYLKEQQITYTILPLGSGLLVIGKG